MIENEIFVLISPIKKGLNTIYLYMPCRMYHISPGFRKSEMLSS